MENKNNKNLKKRWQTKTYMIVYMSELGLNPPVPTKREHGNQSSTRKSIKSDQ